MNNQHKLTFLYTAALLANMLESLDTVHSAICEHDLETVNARGTAEIAAMLREIAYIANESAAEVEANSRKTLTPVYRLMDKGSNGDHPQKLERDGSPRKQPDLKVLVGAETTEPPLFIKKAGG